jgi:hypothetical protein
MITRDPHILRGHIRALHSVPWPIPAVVLIQFTDEDLDELDLAEQAGSRDAYWRCLNRIVGRITSHTEKNRSGARDE